METRANYIAVGLFVLLALIGALASVYWLGRYGEGENLVPLDVRIRGSVSGLAKGSTVQFNGIDVGRVESLKLDPSDPRFVIVRTRVDALTPVRKDTRASIGVRGLSGGAFVQLDGGSPTGSNLLTTALDQTVAPVIEGDPSGLTDLIERVNQLAARSDRILETFEGLVAQNESSVRNTLKNVEVFSGALAQNSDGVAQFMDSAGEIAKSLDGLSGRLEGAVKRAEEILAAVDPEKVASTVSNVEVFTKSIADQRDDIEKIVSSVQETASQLAQTGKTLDTTISRFSDIAVEVKPEQVASILRELEFSSKRAGEVLASVDAITVRQTMDDISQTAAAARGIVANIDEKALNSLISELNSASKNVTTLIESIDAERVNSAVDNIANAASGAKQVVDDVSKVTSRFGNRGDDIDQIVSDAAELTSRLNQTSAKLDGVIDNVDKLLGSGTADGLVADVRNTLAAFRNTAATLDRRISEITAGVTNFTSRGLRDTQTLLRDAGQSINRIDRVIRNIQQNPSALISGAGGSRIRETPAGRPRR